MPWRTASACDERPPPQTLTSTSSFLRSGSLNGLAVTSDKRLPDWPNIPTFKEQGYDLTASIWFALSGPANLPPAILKRMNEEVNKAMSGPEVAARMRRDGMITNPMSPEQFQQFIASEKKVWSPVVKQVGLAVEKK